MKEIRLLIVEDQELIRKSLSIVLNMVTDLEVVGLAGNGQEAVDMADRLQPNVVLMDIHMPVMDGVTATQQIKVRWPEMKIMMLTTFQEMQYVIDALNAGAEGYILKAIDPMDLADAIRLVHRGETMITQEIAKALFAQSLQPAAMTKKGNEADLTERELEVLQHIAAGLANRQIAERMFLSEGTVKNYISSIYAKLNVRNRTSALKKAAEEGLF